MSAAQLSEADWFDDDARSILERRAERERLSPFSIKSALPDLEPPDNDDMSDHIDFPCSPFVWKNPATLPCREWLYGRHYIRKFVSATFAPGGVGKSSLALVEALAMASGKPLLGIRPPKRLTVAYWSGEDPGDENDRRVMAAAIHYGLTADDLNEDYFEGEDVNGDPCSGYDRPRLHVGICSRPRRT